MTQPARPAEPRPIPPSEAAFTVQAGLAETPVGQRVAIVITALLPKDQAEILAKGITDITAQMSRSGLVVATGNGHAVAQHPG